MKKEKDAVARLKEGMERETKRMKSEEEEKRREEACKRAGCNEDMFCYGGKACYDLCDKAMELMKRD